jgi:hypothetical protein
MDLRYFTPQECSAFLSAIESKGLTKRSLLEIIRWVKKYGGNPAYLQRKKKEGVETGYDYRNEKTGTLLTTWTTHSDKIAGLKTQDEAWDVVWPNGSAEPFFFFPQRRTKSFFERKLERIDIAIDIVTHWATCQVCQAPLIIARNPVEVAKRNECLHMRWLICPNGNDKRHTGKAPNMRIVDMPGISDANRARFKEMFDAYLKYENDFFATNHYYPMPRRIMRWFSLQGLSVPKIGPYADLKHEDKYPVYNDRFAEPTPQVAPGASYGDTDNEDRYPTYNDL